MNVKKYNFDEIINREKTHCIKYDQKENFPGTDNVLPPVDCRHE